MATENVSVPTQVNYLDLVVRWAWVGIPLAWGVFETARTSLALFQ